MQYNGSSRQEEISARSRVRETRFAGQKLGAFLKTPFGTVVGLVACLVLMLILLQIPFSGELGLGVLAILGAVHFRTDNRAFDMPFRVPAHANLRDGSSRDGKSPGNGITYLGNDSETGEQIYVSNSDLRTHQIVFGTTGSGKTEYILGLLFNALVQDSGFIYVDGKGDPKTEKDVFRLARVAGREDDLLVINFMNGARDFIEKQRDKVTNNMNIMGNTSSGMLIELIVSLMDDSGGTNGDMWKGRAISFVAALTRVLVYLRDRGVITLSPGRFIEYFEIAEVYRLAYEHNGRYGDRFEEVVGQLKTYLISLPGFRAPGAGGGASDAPKFDQKTLEQHGYIIMQLTRIFTDLNYNYGHIFKTRVGDVDFFDVVLNRRLLCVLLPALERAPDTMKMLGKMVVGSVKQMMAGCLGNRVEGMVRETIDSRSTNASTPFYLVFDEYGLYAVLGFAVAPAQGRSLGFSITFGAQDFESLKKASPEEANATWENTNIRVIGRMTSGMENSETWLRAKGAAGEAIMAVQRGYERTSALIGRMVRQGDGIDLERRSRLEYDDIASQENGEFTFILGKKSGGGRRGSVHVVRGMGFYTAGPDPRAIRLNDFIPIEPPEEADLPITDETIRQIGEALGAGTFDRDVMSQMQPNALLSDLQDFFTRHDQEGMAEARIPEARFELGQAVLHELLSRHEARSAEAREQAARVIDACSSRTAALPAASTGKGARGHAEGGTTGNARQTPRRGSSLRATLMKTRPEKRTRYQNRATDDVTGAHAMEPTPSSTNLIVTPDGKRLPPAGHDMARSAYPFLYRMADEQSSLGAEDIDSEVNEIAPYQSLLQVEALIMGEPADIEEHWRRQSVARKIRAEIAGSTHYIDLPVPQACTQEQADRMIEELVNKCNAIIEEAKQRASDGNE